MAIKIPRNEANPTHDVLGNALQYTGEVPYNATVTGHDGVTNGAHTGCTINFNPNGSPKLANAGLTTWAYGAALPAGVTADIGGDGVYRNIRYA